MRLRDTTGVTPLRRMTVARGRLTLPPGTKVGADEVAAARAAALNAAKDATRLLPTSTHVQVTDAFCDVEVADDGAVVVFTLQGYARESLESAALMATAAALIGLRDALCLEGAACLISGLEVVQSVVG